MNIIAENSKQIDIAKNQLLKYVNNIDIDKLLISSYSKKYLLNYQLNSYYFINHYSQVFKKAISKINKPINDISILDYGGGCGLMSILASLSGVKLIIYNDIFETSCHDAQIISKHLNQNIDYFVSGDVKEMVDFLKEKSLKVDLIISIDVLEHIYNLDQWFYELYKIDTPFTLYFNTGANPKNPFIKKKLIKYQQIAELVGKEESWGWKERDTNKPFIEARKEIILKYHQNLSKTDLELLAQKTRGLNKIDIENVTDVFVKTGTIAYKISHPTNTCDPYTGNWTENLINLEKLLEMLNKLGFKATIENNNYILSNSRLKNLLKLIANTLIFFVKKENLLFSPTYSLMVKKD